MMVKLHQELVQKDEALVKLQVVVQGTREAEEPSISIVEVDTMIETNMVSSYSLDLSQEYFGDFEKHTRGIGSKFLRLMG
jgi:hypothetical protein